MSKILLNLTTLARDMEDAPKANKPKGLSLAKKLLAKKDELKRRYQSRDEFLQKPAGTSVPKPTLSTK